MSSETFHCQKCGQDLPLINKTIHELRCRGPKPKDIPTTTDSSSLIHDSSSRDSGNGASPDVIRLDSSDEYECPSPDRNQPDRWTCQTCTFRGNQIGSGMCEVCGTVDENMAAVAATIAQDNMELDYEDAGADNHMPDSRSKSNAAQSASGGSSSSSNEWTCSQCTMINNLSHQECAACGNVRPGQSSYRDRLIDDSFDDSFFIPDDQGSSSSSALESAYGGAVFGAGLGAALAYMNDHSLVEGAAAGAGVGALGGLMLEELQRHNQRQLLRNNNRGSTRGYSRRSNAYRQTNMMFEDDDADDFTGLMQHHQSAADMFEAHNRLINQMMMMDPAVGMMLRGRGIVGGNGLVDDIDRMSYEQLSERFQQPVRRVDEGTINNLPSRIIPTSSGSSSSGGGVGGGKSAKDAIDLTSSSPPSKVRRMPSNGSVTGSSSSSSAAAPPRAEEEEGCTICLAPYSPGEEVSTLPCLHFFHRECIEGWLRVNHTCPVCKYSLLHNRINA